MKHTDNKDKPANKDFLMIKIIARFILDVIVKFWALSAAGILIFFLIFWLYGGWLAFALLVFAATGVIYTISDWLLYHPNQPVHSRFFVASPNLFGMAFENVTFNTKDGIKLHAFFLKQPRESGNEVPTVLFLHGNAGNIGHRLPNAKGLFLSCGFNVLLLEYRGYGHSDGSPSENGLYLDSQAALEYLRSRPDVNRDRIIVFGRSLGGAVAIDLAVKEQNKLLAVIAENTFTSIPEIGRTLLASKVFSYVPEILIKNKYKTIDKVLCIHIPILFVSGMSDQVIPPKMMQDLYMKCGSSSKRLVRFVNGSHNETWQCDGYYNTMNAFAAQALQYNVKEVVAEETDDVRVHLLDNVV